MNTHTHLKLSHWRPSSDGWRMCTESSCPLPTRNAKACLRQRSVRALRVEYVFTYSCDAAIRI